MKYPSLILVLLIVLAFGLGTGVQPKLVRRDGGHDSDNIFKVLFGEGRRMFANHFVVKADVYFHSGFYPSIFDQAAQAQEQAHGQTATPDQLLEDHHEHEGEAAEGDETNIEGEHCDTDTLGVPLDWIETLGRNFMVTEHTHLKNGNEREILPWLELSADFDPQRIETYTVTAYWLAGRLGKVEEAEQFLRRGLRANPNSHEILFELGNLYYKHLKDPERARNVWLLGLRRWDEVEARKEVPDTAGRRQLLDHLGLLEEEQGNYPQAIRYFELAKPFSPSPEALDERIREIQQKHPQSASGTNSAPY